MGFADDMRQKAEDLKDQAQDQWENVTDNNHDNVGQEQDQFAESDQLSGRKGGDVLQGTDPSMDDRPLVEDEAVDETEDPYLNPERLRSTEEF
jgi:hypothetical protein